mmetsp:Transcript_34389/g.74252  ORF Transcript_34389/g.74252 Transcript_34389/m.74252 type:complete len:255 (-) Transcript_34389:1238-2002(-)
MAGNDTGDGCCLGWSRPTLAVGLSLGSVDGSGGERVWVWLASRRGEVVAYNADAPSLSSPLGETEDRTGLVLVGDSLWARGYCVASILLSLERGERCRVVGVVPATPREASIRRLCASSITSRIGDPCVSRSSTSAVPLRAGGGGDGGGGVDVAVSFGTTLAMTSATNVGSIDSFTSRRFAIASPVSSRCANRCARCSDMGVPPIPGSSPDALTVTAFVVGGVRGPDTLTVTVLVVEGVRGDLYLGAARRRGLN